MNAQTIEYGRFVAALKLLEVSVNPTALAATIPLHHLSIYLQELALIPDRKAHQYALFLGHIDEAAAWAEAAGVKLVADEMIRAYRDAVGRGP